MRMLEAYAGLLAALTVTASRHRVVGIARTGVAEMTAGREAAGCTAVPWLRLRSGHSARSRSDLLGDLCPQA
jgi:hypothetical protein